MYSFNGGENGDFNKHGNVQGCLFHKARKALALGPQKIRPHNEEGYKTPRALCKEKRPY